MSVNVLIPTILIASTSYIQPVFDVNYSYAVAQINYTQPVFQASYMQVQVTAEVTFPDVLGVEIVTPTDLVALTFDKQLSDNTEGFEDFVSRVFGKGLADSFTMEDAILVTRQIEKSLADTAASNDNTVLLTSLLKLEILASSDSTTLSTEKALADSFTMEDSIEIRRQIEKSLADTQSITEILSTSVAKALEDGSILAELASLTATKALTDTQIVIEILSTAAVKALADTQIVTETLNTAVVKALEDGSILAELASLATTKALADSFTMEDSIEISRQIAKALADTTDGFVDLAYLATTKAIEDTTDGFVDLASLATAKAVEDTQIVTETLNTAVVKALADSFTMEDSIQISRLIEKTLEDATDGFVDQITSKATNKGLSDNFNLIDNMDGDIEYNIVKLVGELLITSDDQIIAFTQQLSDNAVASSNGTLVMQDYCDITYFLTDYVGASRTFT